MSPLFILCSIPNSRYPWHVGKQKLVLEHDSILEAGSEKERRFRNRIKM